MVYLNFLPHNECCFNKRFVRLVECASGNVSPLGATVDKTSIPYASCPSLRGFTICLGMTILRVTVDVRI